MSWLAKYSTTIAFSCMVGLLIAYTIFETTVVPDSFQPQTNIQAEIDHSLREGADFFEELSTEFQRKTDQVNNDINNAIQTGAGRMALHNRLEQYDLWGITIFHENQKWLWTGFDVSEPSDSTISKNLSDTTSIVNFNNVVAFFNLHTFTFNDDHYTVLSADKLYQVSDLPISEDRVQQFSEEPNFQNRYPVYFNFFGNTPRGAAFRTLSTTYSDSVGTIYADPNQTFSLLERENKLLQSYRFVFHIAIFFLFSLHFSHGQKTIKIVKHVPLHSL